MDQYNLNTFQTRVLDWLVKCFDTKIARDPQERNYRFLEEALELVQSCGCNEADAHQLVDYVYTRPKGEKGQEVGGVMVTLAALCSCHDMSLKQLAEIELVRVYTKIEQIREKQAAKKIKSGPLP